MMFFKTAKAYSQEGGKSVKQRGIINRDIYRNILVVVILLSVLSCGEKNETSRQEFSSPVSTYLFWLKAGVDGNFADSTICLSKASRVMMDQMTKDRDEFMRRMTSSSTVFNTYSVIEEKISGDKALVLIESPNKKARIAVPLVMEGLEWKVDLVKMFGG